MTPTQPRGGNFDMIRLIAACAVIFGHSFLFGRPFDRLAEFADTLSVSAVETFFIISGYLVTQSFDRSRSWLRFVLARSLRIFPGLVACVLFVLGPAFTKLPLSEYFANPTLLYFTVYNSFLDVKSFPFLPQVAFHSNEGGAIINGSLWSLPWEYACYGVVLTFGVLRRLDGWTASILIVLTSVSLTFHILDSFAWFLSYFAAGMGMYFLRNQHHRFRGWLACLAGLAVVIGNYGPLPWAFFPILGAYFIIYVALDAPFHFKNATRFGDLSYGIYLYGWPAQEIAVYISGGEPPWWQIFALALPMAATLAWLSWHGVEQPMLRWKDVQLIGLRQRVGAAAVVCYAATASVFPKIFALGSVLPAVLALTGAATLAWVYRMAHPNGGWMLMAAGARMALFRSRTRPMLR
jgi:peptidoglycan/LPS O-acetylase OafA/YrhL